MDINYRYLCISQFQLRQNTTKPPTLACVANGSVRFRRKERGTRVKDREKSGVSKRAWRGWGRKEGNACRQTPGFENHPLGLSRLSSRTDI